MELQTNLHQSTNSFADMYKSRDPIIAMQDLPTQEKPNDPHSKTAPKHPTTYCETLLHLFKGNIGSGLYALGDAFKNAGIVLAPIATVCLGIMSVHTQHLLLSASGEMKEKMNMATAPDFAETVELSFSTGPSTFRKLSVLMRRLVNMFLCITQLGFCCVYFVFISTNMKKIADYYGWVVSLHVHMLLTLIVITMTCFIRNLKYLTPVSTAANLCMFIGIAIIMYFASIDLPPISERKPIADWNQLPLFFGTVIYAFEAIGLVLPLKNEMKNPKQFQTTFGVLNVGSCFIITLYVAVGFMGYLKWGEEVQGSLTLNLPEENIISHVVQGLIAIGILLTYPLQFYVPVEITWPGVQEKFGPFNRPVVIELLYRTFLVLITFVLAAVIPHLGLFISLVGAVSSTALALIFPPTIQLLTRSQDPGGLSWWILIKNTLILILGFVGFLTGTFESIRSIIGAFRKDYF